MNERIPSVSEWKGIGVRNSRIRERGGHERANYGFVDSTGSLNAGLSVSAMLREASVAGS